MVFLIFGFLWRFIVCTIVNCILDKMSIAFQSMLCLDPSKRITARIAVEHEYFKDIKFVPWFHIFMENVFIVIFVQNLWVLTLREMRVVFCYFLQDLGVGTGSYFHFLSYRIFQNQLECDHIAFYFSFCPVNAMQHLSFQFVWYVWCCFLIQKKRVSTFFQDALIDKISFICVFPTH